MGISGLFVAFGFGVAPLVLSSLIETFQWQTSLRVLFCAVVVMSMIAFLFFRHSPESIGLKLDGGLLNPQEASSDGPESIQEESFTIEEAKRFPVFWIFNLGTMAQAMLVTAVTFHIARIGLLNHLSPAESFRLFLPLAFVSTSADLLGGYLSDRVPMKSLLMVMQTGLAIGLVSLNFFGTTLGFWLTAIGLGISSGLFSLLVGAAWPKLFGRKFLGSISGYNMAWIVSGSALGPVLFGISEHFTGKFTWSICACAVLPIGLLISAKWANPPQKE